MAKKIKRKAREKLIKKVDLLFPVDITKLGSDEDPCFGKHFDAKDPACQRCGDSELCQVMLAQKLNVMRANVEKKGKYRDIEEQHITKPGVLDKRKLKKAIRALVKKHTKISLEVLSKDLAAIHNTKPSTVLKVVTGMLKKTNKFTLSKNHLVWKGEG